MLWRLHIRPAAKNGKTHDDVVRYCIENHVAGIGWPVSTETSTVADYERAARSQYGNHVASITFSLEPQIGEFIWARDKNGRYYLGRIQGHWYYSNDPLHLELDIPNQRACKWIEVGSEENVPGKIVACFRPAKTFQPIRDQLMEEFSEWTFSHVPESNSFMEGINMQPNEKKKFFQFIGADDCEDIVGLYLQRVKGYCIIPSSCKRTTIGYEFILKHSITAESAIVQVKQGKINLDERLKGIADHVFLFSTDGVVTSKSQNVTVLYVDELFDFAYHNKKLLPLRINYWLHFLT